MKKIDLKQIGTLLDKKLDQKLKPIKQTLNSHDQQFKRINQRLDCHGKQFERINQKLDAHSESLVIIENNVKVLPDVGSLIKHHSEKLEDHEKRIGELEETQTLVK